MDIVISVYEKAPMELNHLKLSIVFQKSRKVEKIDVSKPYSYEEYIALLEKLLSTAKEEIHK